MAPTGLPSPRFGVRQLLTGLLIVIALAITTAMRPELAWALPLTLVDVVVLFAAQQRLAPVVLSPAYYFALFTSAIGYFGALLGNGLAGAGGTSGANHVLPSVEVVRTCNLFMLASITVLVGACAARGRRDASPGASGEALRVLFDFGRSPRLHAVILVAAVAELALLVGATGLAPLLNRPSYLFQTSSGVLSTGLQMVSLGMVVALGIVAFSSRPPARVCAAVLILLLAGYFVSLGTRRLALIPLLLLFSAVWVNRGAVRKRALALAGVCSLATLSLPLTFRSLPTHGLLPHLAGLAQLQFGMDQLRSDLNNVLVGFRITALTAYERPVISAHAFAVSISPLPGDALGWPAISRDLRLNEYTPYSAIGEIGNHGMVFAVLAFLMLGVLLGLIQRGNDLLLSARRLKVLAVLVLGLVLLFVVQSIQYNLRSTSRYVYLALGVQLAVLAVRAALPAGAPAVSRTRPRTAGGYAPVIRVARQRVPRVHAPVLPAPVLPPAVLPAPDLAVPGVAQRASR